MKTISLAVAEKDYELFRQMAERENRSIASLIRDAMANYIARGGQAGAPSASAQALLPGPGRYRIYAEVEDAG